MQRKGTLVIRPDSGDAVAVLETIFNIAAEKFGYEVNRKGWKVIAPQVRFIQGDGVNYHTIQNMIFQLTRRGWSMDNWSFGMGGALLQQINSDTLRFALKCSAIDIDGQWHDVYKQPVTDPGKDSRAGRFVLLKEGQDFVTLKVDGDAFKHRIVHAHVVRFRADGLFLIGIENHEVSIGAHRDSSFARIQTEKFGRRCRNNFDETIRREAFAVHPAREDKAEAVLDTGAAIGNLGEIVLA